MGSPHVLVDPASDAHQTGYGARTLGDDDPNDKNGWPKPFNGDAQLDLGRAARRGEAEGVANRGEGPAVVARAARRTYMVVNCVA